MYKKLTLDITDIQTIIQKTETEPFNYQNTNRPSDGFVLLLSGNGSVICNGKRAVLSAGDLFFVSAGDNYTIQCPCPCSYITSALTLHTDKSLLPFLLQCNERQRDKLKDICNIWQSHQWDSYAATRIKLLNFYYEIIKASFREQISNQEIAKAIDYIHKHFKTNFSGKTVAEYCSLSPSYLRAKFLNATGMTITEYRDALRISSAKEMLESRQFTVSEIAAALGYCDVYHFSKAFTSKVGSSPKKWLNRTIATPSEK